MRRRFRPRFLGLLTAVFLGWAVLHLLHLDRRVGVSSPAPGAPTSQRTKGSSAAGATGQDPALPASVLLEVPPQSQLPQLPNGCEVTTLSMLLTAVGHPVDKMTLSQMIAYDPTPRVKSASGQVLSWGNPNVGFVGSMTVWQNGFGVYHGPVAALLDRILPGRAVDLTGKPIAVILRQLAKGIPVEIWVTTTLKPTDLWVTWQSPEGPVHTTMNEHVVLLVGYDKTDFFVNNPLNGEADQAVPKDQLLGAWRQLGEQAVSVTPAPSQAP